LNDAAKVAVVHHTLNSTGGGEVLALELIEALLERKYDVSLATNEPTNWSYVEDRLGFNLKNRVEEYRLLPIRIRAFGIYQRPMIGFMIPIMKLKHKLDIVINTHGDIMPIPTDIVYMHFPTLALMELSSKVYAKYYSSTFWRIYFEPYRFLQNLFKYSLSKYTRILTNSNFSRMAVKYAFDRDAEVVYPPVRLDFYKPLQKEAHDKDWVMTVSRISNEKKLEWIPLIAKYVPKNVTFYVVGAAGRLSLPVIERIVKKAEETGVNDRVKILTNLSLRDKLSLMAKAKVYLHTMPFEHFGISIVEAMASGLIPIVHKSGGAWLDIVERGKYGLGWGLNELDLRKIGLSEEAMVFEEDYKNAGELISQSLDTHNDLREIAMHRAEDFSNLKFRSRMLKIIESYLKEKCNDSTE
jgi:glycosyltransferase involved in cell wall biosynthesis